MAGITAAPLDPSIASDVTTTAAGTNAGAVIAPSADMLRIKYGALLIVAAFVLLGVVFAVAIAHFTAAADVTAVVGSVATIVGTVIGAFFGVQIGSSGKEAANHARDAAEKRTRAALAQLPPQDAEHVLRSV